MNSACSAVGAQGSARNCQSYATLCREAKPPEEARSLMIPSTMNSCFYKGNTTKSLSIISFCWLMNKLSDSLHVYLMYLTALEVLHFAIIKGLYTQLERIALLGESI
jgi:hypothetical protein